MGEPEAATPPAGRAPLRVWAALSVGLVAFGVSAILVRLANAPQTGVEPPEGLAVAAWRTLFAAALLAPVAVPRARATWGRVSTRDWALIVAAGALLALHFVAWIESLYHTSVASSSVLVNTSPLFIAALGFLVLGERAGGRTVAAILLAVVGADAGRLVYRCELLRAVVTGASTWRVAAQLASRRRASSSAEPAGAVKTVRVWPGSAGRGMVS